ncbi:hypothetical protein N7517_008096, partial [Penicillium concentricum]
VFGDARYGQSWSEDWPFAHLRVARNSEIPHDQGFLFGRPTLPHSDSTTLKYTSLDSGSAYEPPSSPPDPPKAVAHRVPTRSQTSCAPSAVHRRSQSPDSSGSDSNQAIGASAKLHPPHLPNEQAVNGTREIIKATRPGITMRNFAPNDVYSNCSLATKTLTDAHLLAVAGHTPFKLTCVEYGYTIVRKGTTSGLWKEVSREVQVY